MKKIMLIIIITLISIKLLSINLIASSNTGKGSFSENSPLLDESSKQIYITENYHQSIPTNSWANSIFYNKYSDTLNISPYSAKYTASGLEIVNLNVSDFVVGSSNCDYFDDSRVNKLSSFSVDTILKNKNASIKSTLVKGNPFIFFEFENGAAQITFKSTPQIYIGSSCDNVIGISINNNFYALFSPSNSIWKGFGTNKLSSICPSEKNYFSICMLPDSKESTFNYFKNYGFTFITDTNISWNYDEIKSTLNTTYKVNTTCKEGNINSTIFCLYPYQWKDNNLILPLEYQYTTNKDLLKTLSGKSFSTQYKFNGVIPYLPSIGVSDKNNLNQMLADFDKKENYLKKTDVYNTSKDLGQFSSLLSIANEIENEKLASKFEDHIKTTLEDWFTYSNNEKANYFYKNRTFGKLLGYGTNSIFENHFIYDNFINAASQIAFKDSLWSNSSNYGEFVNLLIKSIVNFDSNNNSYNFLDNFDQYEDCNRKDKTEYFNSLSMWKSIIFWGQSTNSITLRNLGIYLYTTDLQKSNLIDSESNFENFDTSLKTLNIFLNKDITNKDNSYYTINSLTHLGQPDYSITSDFPLSFTFNNKGIKTYIVYNYTSSTKTVTFSDGFTLVSSPNKLSSYSKTE